MDQLKIKTYTPDCASYAPRIRAEQWDQHKSLLKHLHDEGYKRAAMLDVLRKQGFRPSLGQLNAKMTAWGFKVYGTQPESLDQDADGSSWGPSLESADTEMADPSNNDSTQSPASRRSISSITLCEPERQLNAQYSDRNLTLDEVIIMQSLALAGAYWPHTRPSDFGFKPPTSTGGVDNLYRESIVLVADFLCAVHCFEQAFDLYYHVFEHLVATDIAKDASLVRGLVQCAISATTDAQCGYVLSIIRRAHAYCVEHVMTELASCFSSLSKDLCVKDLNGDDFKKNPQSNRVADMPLLIATDSDAKSVAYRKEWLQQQLSDCDEACATLAHLSLWCQDTLSFYRLEKQPITGLSPQASDKINEIVVFEHDFQILISALIIDYLNSPGPSMKKADLECKDSSCLFRWALSPSTSLIIMAHLLYEPLRLQSQSTTNRYLQSRAKQFDSSRTTTALQELKAFASANSNARCSAFVDTYLKHFNTTYAFRRYISNTNCGWDRITAAKRLAQVLQSNQNGVLPHAGLPSARRSVLKTMIAPFPHDPILTESRPSMVSDGGSIGEFERLASQIGLAHGATGSITPSDAMSIDTRSSWSFHRVTGFASGLFSGRSSVSLRRGDQDEAEEYKQFIRDNNYDTTSTPTDPNTPTQHYSTPTMKDFLDLP